MIIYKYIQHDSCITFLPIFSPINPIIISPCMFLDHIHENYNPSQCIMPRIITPLCLYVSNMMTSQQEMDGYYTSYYQSTVSK